MVSPPLLFHQLVCRGLWFIWDVALRVEIVFTDSWVVHAKIDNEDGPPWFFTGVYGSPDPYIRRAQWEIFPSFKPDAFDPWLCLGDFNDISCPEEKCGRRPANRSQITHFLNMINATELMDLDFVGSIFTWSNKQQIPYCVLKRLDRGMCNVAWRNLHPDAKLIHQSTLCSDHKILVLKSNPNMIKLKRPFRFEAMWLSDPSCQNVVKTTIESPCLGSPSFSFFVTLGHCRKALIKWNHEHFGHLEVKIRWAYELLKEHQRCMTNRTPSEDDFRREDDLLRYYKYYLRLKEIHWAQKARQDSFTMGEMNTRYFHTLVNRQRHRCSIDTLKCPRKERSHHAMRLMHLFISCPFARALWFGAHISQEIYKYESENFKERLIEIIDGMSKLDDEYFLTLFGAVLWQIWLARNDARFMDVTPQPVSHLYKAIHTASAMTHYKHEGKEVKRSIITVHWSFPPDS
ncbi:hypothetical protein IFM89_004717 [Coptis chinensis]|uniref:Uncharacterized protein n=1 Tax=Coptis chinensis TaxID=261450 RepID=A0A835LAZ9_9MAGN|nr:hypothetical protein IFM89_004717 [Coptis chinensis]